ncbi:uncharacterized protein [Rutidosis leptorrhynchoides]|uniref:uncharacterized protein n=1 Tax=Rutidosis leptorrhynchoides TaxID=125765 RepID=UPI003A99132E
MPKNIDANDLPWDPADRKPILDYNPNQREEIRRLYCQRGPCQPSDYLDQFGQQAGSDAFLSSGFDSWGKKKRLAIYVGEIDNLFAEPNVSLKQIRGQGYDGASNMRGEFNGLKALILKDNSSAYYIHCFAHQLQLVVATIAKHHEGVGNFFDMLGVVINVVCASCKRKDMIRESYKDRIQKEIGKGEIETGTGLHQELSLIRAGDTRWGSHHKTMLGLISLFPEVVQVLEYVKKDGDNPLSRRQASGILSYFNTFDFVLYLHLMLRILGLTNALSQSLQRKDQNVVEAVSLVHGTKRSLLKFREKGFDEILKHAYSFCEQHTLESLDMDELYIISRNRKTNFTNRHYFKVDIFTTVMDR